jgi:hypothetical protein
MLTIDDLLAFDYGIEIDADNPDFLFYWDYRDEHQGMVHYLPDDLQRLKRFAKQILALELPLDG